MGYRPKACAGFVALLMLVTTASTMAQTRRGVPRAKRATLLGCIEPWPGEQWQIRASGPTGLRARITFDRDALRGRFRTHGRPRTYETSLIYVVDQGRIQMDCGPTTQHGQFCMVAVEGETIRVALYARGHGDRHRNGRLVEVVVARRCE